MLSVKSVVWNLISFANRSQSSHLLDCSTLLIIIRGLLYIQYIGILYSIVLTRISYKSQ